VLWGWLKIQMWLVLHNWVRECLVGPFQSKNVAEITEHLETGHHLLSIYSVIGRKQIRCPYSISDPGGHLLCVYLFAVVEIPGWKLLVPPFMRVSPFWWWSGRFYT
jgi:hypothetical protein